MTATSSLTVFSTPLGWCAFRWSDQRLRQLTFGHRSPQAACAALAATLQDASSPDPAGQRLIDRLTAYAGGQPQDFRDVLIEVPRQTPFQRRVLDACRQIPWGQTRTYADLATVAGSPRAARAVGNVMAHNPLPLIVPCHRVVGSDRALRGFSAPAGISMKRRLLQLENSISRAESSARSSRPLVKVAMA